MTKRVGPDNPISSAKCGIIDFVKNWSLELEELNAMWNGEFHLWSILRRNPNHRVREIFSLYQRRLLENLYILSMFSGIIALVAS